jgi:PiT family inorganic phosphate transporter
MGHRITRLTPVGGFAAETAGAATLFLATQGGIPVSTTHTIAGAIAGAGSLRRFSAVRWRIAQNMGWAWVLTMPVSALISAVIFLCAEAAKSSGLW